MNLYIVEAIRHGKDWKSQFDRLDHLEDNKLYRMTFQFEKKKMAKKCLKNLRERKHGIYMG